MKKSLAKLFATFGCVAFLTVPAGTVLVSQSSSHVPNLTATLCQGCRQRTG